MARQRINSLATRRTPAEPSSALLAISYALVCGHSTPQALRLPIDNSWVIMVVCADNWHSSRRIAAKSRRGNSSGSFQREPVGSAAPYLRLIQDEERVGTNIARHLDGALWEARPEFGGIEYRLVYFMPEGILVVVLSGFVKKTQRTPPAEIEKAHARREAYLAAERKAG